MADVHITGLDGILDAMSKLTSKVQKKDVSHALRAGGKLILNDARTRAAAFDDPMTHERVASQIAMRANTKYAKRQGYDLGVAVGVLNANKKGDFHYSWFLEEGSAHVRAQPFMRPAAESQADAALNAIVTDLQQSIFGA